MRSLKQALIFLTILPLRLSGEFQPGDLGRAAAWYPLVGLLIGAALAAALWGLALILPGMAAGVLVTGLWALLTGGLHLDGLADCGDGLLSAAAPERRLEIMKDPRLGTFGGIALVAQLLLKVSLITALAAAPARLIVVGLLTSPVLARWLVLIVGWQPMARPGGLGAEFKLGLSPRAFWLAAVLPVVLLIVGGPRGMLAAVLAHSVALGAIVISKRRLGGATGDVIGMTIELAESAAMLAFVVRLPFGW